MKIMDIVIVVLWITLFLIIPVAILFFGGISYGKDEELSTLTFKTLISFFFYFIATIASYLILQIAALYADPRHGEMDSTGKIIALLAVYFYGFVGYLLCSFINGSFLNPLKISFIYSKNTQSICKK